MPFGGRNAIVEPPAESLLFVQNLYNHANSRFMLFLPKAVLRSKVILFVLLFSGAAFVRAQTAVVVQTNKVVRIMASNLSSGNNNAVPPQESSVA